MSCLQAFNGFLPGLPAVSFALCQSVFNKAGRVFVQAEFSSSNSFEQSPLLVFRLPQSKGWPPYCHTVGPSGSGVLFFSLTYLLFSLLALLSRRVGPVSDRPDSACTYSIKALKKFFLTHRMPVGHSGQAASTVLTKSELPSLQDFMYILLSNYECLIPNLMCRKFQQTHIEKC